MLFDYARVGQLDKCISQATCGYFLGDFCHFIWVKAAAQHHARIQWANSLAQRGQQRQRGGSGGKQCEVRTFSHQALWINDLCWWLSKRRKDETVLVLFILFLSSLCVLRRVNKAIKLVLTKLEFTRCPVIDICLIRKIEYFLSWLCESLFCLFIQLKKGRERWNYMGGVGINLNPSFVSKTETEHTCNHWQCVYTEGFCCFFQLSFIHSWDGTDQPTEHFYLDQSSCPHRPRNALNFKRVMCR